MALTDARRWLRFAEEGLAQARVIAGQSQFQPRHAAWLAQQAAEKAIKAVLVAANTRFPRTHDLDALLLLTDPHHAVRRTEADLSRLTEYAVEARYPGDWPDLTEAEAREAVDDAALVVEAARQDVTGSLYSTSRILCVCTETRQSGLASASAMAMSRASARRGPSSGWTQSQRRARPATSCVRMRAATSA